MFDHCQRNEENTFKTITRLIFSRFKIRNSSLGNGNVHNKDRSVLRGSAIYKQRVSAFSTNNWLLRLVILLTHCDS